MDQPKPEKYTDISEFLQKDKKNINLSLKNERDFNTIFENLNKINPEQLNLITEITIEYCFNKDSKKLGNILEKAKNITKVTLTDGAPGLTSFTKPFSNIKTLMIFTNSRQEYLLDYVNFSNLDSVQHLNIDRLTKVTKEELDKLKKIEQFFIKDVEISNDTNSGITETELYEFLNETGKNINILQINKKYYTNNRGGATVTSLKRELKEILNSRIDSDIKHIESIKRKEERKRRREKRKRRREKRKRRREEVERKQRLRNQFIAQNGGLKGLLEELEADDVDINQKAGQFDNLLQNNGFTDEDLPEEINNTKNFNSIYKAVLTGGDVGQADALQLIKKLKTDFNNTVTAAKDQIAREEQRRRDEERRAREEEKQNKKTWREKIQSSNSQKTSTTEDLEKKENKTGIEIEKSKDIKIYTTERGCPLF